MVISWSTYVMFLFRTMQLLLLVCVLETSYALIQLPLFALLKQNYPGYYHYGGGYRNKKLLELIGVQSNYLIHDTSALRLSYALNTIGDVHSLGDKPISLSVNGRDSLQGRNGKQYIFHPISYGPYLADKYGYPNVSRLHSMDSFMMKTKFWGYQGIMQILTYTQKDNLPKGHMALWDCNRFYQSQDWLRGHSLLTIEFWITPDSQCAQESNFYEAYDMPSKVSKSSVIEHSLDNTNDNPSSRTQYSVYKVYRPKIHKTLTFKKLRDNDQNEGTTPVVTENQENFYNHVNYVNTANDETRLRHRHIV